MADWLNRVAFTPSSPRGFPLKADRPRKLSIYFSLPHQTNPTATYLSPSVHRVDDTEGHTLNTIAV